MGKVAGVQIFLQSRRSVGVSIWGGDVGCYPPHGTGPRGGSGPGGAETDGASPTAAGK